MAGVPVVRIIRAGEIFAVVVVTELTVMRSVLAFT